MRKRTSGSRRVVVVLVTCPTRTAARRIAALAVERRFAACVNLIPAVESIFRWQGKTTRCRETLLVIKTTAGRFTALKRAILALHPYDVPEVVALPVTMGHPSYLSWVVSSVHPA